jgi:drug/metabolite transporter (DMT)-like permease
VRGPDASVMVATATFFAVFGVLAWFFLGRRKGNRYVGWQLLVGLPGLYLAGLASMGEPKWLFIPGLTLMGVGVLLEVLSWRRPRSKDGRAGTPAGPSDPRRGLRGRRRGPRARSGGARWW